MPSKYPTCNSQEVLKVLKKFGFMEVSQKGSHRKLSNGSHIVIIPIHKKDLKTGTLKSILEQANLTVEEFERYL